MMLISLFNPSSDCATRHGNRHWRWVSLSSMASICTLFVFYMVL